MQVKLNKIKVKFNKIDFSCKKEGENNFSALSELWCFKF